jgi:hypothetical protein
LLREAKALLGQEGVSIRCDADLLETAYVEVGADGVVVHDRGDTFLYLAGATASSTYVPWSEAVAAEACSAFGVALIDNSDDDSASYSIERRLGTGEELRGVVQAVSEAVDAVFRRHLRPDLSY